MLTNFDKYENEYREALYSAMDAWDSTFSGEISLLCKQAFLAGATWQIERIRAMCEGEIEVAGVSPENYQ